MKKRSWGLNGLCACCVPMQDFEPTNFVEYWHSPSHCRVMQIIILSSWSSLNICIHRHHHKTQFLTGRGVRGWHGEYSLPASPFIRPSWLPHHHHFQIISIIPYNTIVINFIACHWWGTEAVNWTCVRQTTIVILLNLSQPWLIRIQPFLHFYGYHSHC